jgi:hypothetical protein
MNCGGSRLDVVATAGRSPVAEPRAVTLHCPIVIFFHERATERSHIAVVAPCEKVTAADMLESIADDWLTTEHFPTGFPQVEAGREYRWPGVTGPRPPDSGCSSGRALHGWAR